MKWRTSVVVGVSLVSFLLILLTCTYFLSQGGCNVDLFTCSVGSVCVPQRSVCNGYADCPDAEDESVQTCGNFHGSTYIMGLMKEAKGNASRHPCGQEGVPAGCYCRSQVWVYCKNLNLTSIPTHIKGNVSRLILSNNSISSIADDAFQHYLLELIHLEGNGLMELPVTVFHTQKSLKKLLLMNNKLQAIDQDLLKGLQNLSMLYLQKNNISFLAETAFKDLSSLRFLDLSENRLTLAEMNFPAVPALSELLLDGNEITNLNGSEFLDVSSLMYLGLSHNQLHSIHPNTFRVLENLVELDVSHNKLINMLSDVFHLKSLRKLFLGHNPLEDVPDDLFQGLPELRSLDLEEIEITNIQTSMFKTMPHLDFIYFKKYYYCTYAPAVPKCEPKSDGLSTFEDLLGRPVLRVLLWVIAVTTCIGNVYVFLGRHAARDDNRSLSWIVRNLAISDFLMGIYLVAIGLKDMEFRGIYHTMSHTWMGSWICIGAGALAMLSSEVSIFILVFMSIERFLLIAMPFSGMNTLSPRAAGRCLIFIWVFGFTIAVCPMLMYRSSTHFYGANAMCFPLHLDDPYFTGWQVSAFVFLFLNLNGLLLVALLYSGMFISVWRTRNATTLSSGDFEFAVRFFFIVLTNTACWLPIVVLKILAFYRIYIPASAYAWITVIVVPINSAFNPLLYTLTTPKYRELIRNILFAKTNKQRYTKPITSVDTSCSNASNPRGRVNTMEVNEYSLNVVRPRSISHSSFDEGTNNDPVITLHETIHLIINESCLSNQSSYYMDTYNDTCDDIYM